MSNGGFQGLDPRYPSTGGIDISSTTKIFLQLVHYRLLVLFLTNLLWFAHSPLFQVKLFDNLIWKRSFHLMVRWDKNIAELCSLSFT